MKTKLLTVALLASAALIAPAKAGNGHHGGGGGGNFAPARSSSGGAPSFRSMPAARFGGGASFRSMPMRSFSGNRTIYSGQRFSSVAPPVQRSTEFRSQRFQSNVGASLAGRELARGSINHVGGAPGFASRGNQSIANMNRQGNGQFRNRGNQFGNGFARNNNAIRNQRSAQFGNGNGNARLRSDWHNHVFAQRSANWHRDWDRGRDHWWNGHRCHFFNGSWVIFDAGFYPWWPWGYPYDYYYGYGYGYPYNYGYSGGYGYGYNDPGAYDDQSGYDNGYDDQSANQQSGYGNQSANSTVAAVQDRLARGGYYRGQIDGVLGPETRHAIVRFQSNHGLQVTGELSPDTLNAMGLQNYASY
jgi:hypothetical protein